MRHEHLKVKFNRRLIDDTASSILFLSRFPIRTTTVDSVPDFQLSAYTFPIAGLAISIFPAFILWTVSAIGLSNEISALLCIASMVLITGALHEDGLADVADGFWGGHSKQQRLKIMRDSAIGTYGVLALIFAIGLRFVLLATLISKVGAINASVLYVAIASLSRTTMLYPWVVLPSARLSEDQITDKSGKVASGLSVRFGKPDRSAFFDVFILAIPALLIVWYHSSFLGWVISLTLTILMVLGFSNLCERKISGQTGDTLGATQQLSELCLFLALIMTI